MKEKDMKRRKAEKQAELSEKKVRMPMLSKKNKIKMERKLHDNSLYVRNDSRKKECFVRLFLPAFL